MNFILMGHGHRFPLYRRFLPQTVSHTGYLVTKASLSPSQSHLKVRERSPLFYLHPLSFSTSRCVDKSVTDNLKEDLKSVIKKVDLNQLKQTPVAANLYGFGGIIPFVFPPLYFIVGSFSPFLATAQLVYGATILAFVGGVKWGNALAKNEITHQQIGISTVPSLVAWVSLLVPESIGFLIVSSGLVGTLYVDLISSKYPPWFCAMRCALTSIATASLLTTFIFYVFN